MPFKTFLKVSENVMVWELKTICAKTRILDEMKLGGDYMIPFCWEEISFCPDGTDFTLQFYNY